MAAIFAFSFRVAHAGASAPNIIFILVDDMGWKDVSYHGSEIETPNIDRIAASGLKLERAYAYPTCSPTRAALLTGQNPIKFGIDGPMENDAQLPPNIKLLPQYLKEAGYKTWMVGKWHLGMSHVTAMPHRRGFDYFYGQLGGFLDFYTHVYLGRLDWQRNGVTVREEGYATHLQTDDAIRLIKTHDRKQPFFLYLSYNSPHTPLQYPPHPTNLYDGIENSDRRVYAQMMNDLDMSIGRVEATLSATGMRDNTMIIFMSDNGGNLEAGAYNGQLRGGKDGLHEGSVRVPAFISWPARLKAGTKSSQPVFVQDWLPTLMEIINHPTGSNIEGHSVWQNLTGGKTNRNMSPVILGTVKGKAVYEWPMKYIRYKDPNIAGEVYNIVTDPLETENLISESQDLISRLGASLDALPRKPSKGAKGPPPEFFFRGEDGKFDYNIVMPETAEPWADVAIGTSR